MLVETKKQPLMSGMSTKCISLWNVKQGKWLAASSQITLTGSNGHLLLTDKFDSSTIWMLGSSNDENNYVLAASNSLDNLNGETGEAFVDMRT